MSDLFEGTIDNGDENEDNGCSEFRESNLDWKMENVELSITWMAAGGGV
jgi:hypothetical protein